MTQEQRHRTGAGITTWAPSAVSRGRFVVLPGRGDDVEHYRRLGHRLSADGYTVYAPDAPIVSAEDVLSALVALGSSDTPTIVVGVDASAGHLAVAISSGVPSGRAVDGLVLAGTALATDEETVAISRDAEIALRTSCPLHTEVLRATSAPSLTRSRATATWPDAPVDVPTLVVHGSADTLAPIDGVLAVTADWPRRELVIIRGGMHDVLNDRHHRTVAAELVSFAERFREDADAPPLVERRAPVGAAR